MNATAFIAAALATACTAASASYVSTFDFTGGDFVLSGFAAGGFPTPGPTVGSLTNITGSYDLDIPVAGTSWDIFVEGSMNFDFDEDGIYETVMAIPYGFVETATSTGPATSFTNTVAVADFDIDTGLGGIITISGLMATIFIDVDGPYGSGPMGAGATMNVSLSGGDIFILNAFIDAADNAGLDDDIMTAGFFGDFTVTLIPAPGALALLGMGGMIATRRRRA
ncbi:MAG: hypothetical protein JKY43_01770 [Phycisphaerales bacterium]|nr:hypothetical protein [Phycisphaerales bacterium]